VVKEDSTDITVLNGSIFMEKETAANTLQSILDQLTSLYDLRKNENGVWK
jgi:hypothetical protein